jgi:signal transduction histidine kinase
MNGTETADLRQIKHDLRTPVNHIAGYGELALEEARDEADCAAEESLKQLVDAARSLAAAIDKELTGDAAQRDPVGCVAALKRSLEPQLESILNLSTGAGGAFDAAPYEPDLKLVRTAVERLRAYEPHGPPAPPQAAQTLRPATPGTAEYILIVDDDPANRDVLVRFLEGDGYRLECAASGEEALERLAAGPADLVLLDMLMPGIGGYEVFQQMQAAPRLRDIPVIMISALDDLSAVVRSIEAGAEDYLTKPFEPVLLRARIGASLSKRRLRRQIVAQERLASLGAITAGVAHEIKNPLNFVLNFADLSRELAAEVREDEPAGSPRAELLDDLERNLTKIVEHARRADGIVAGMLLHARSGNTDRERFDLNKLVGDSVHLARHGTAWTREGEQLEVETHFDPAAGAIEGIPADLGRVFLNLANNALYAAMEKHRQVRTVPARVEVRTRRDGNWREVQIRDNGPGIPPGLRDRIFQPFFTTKPTGSGTGLGLSISFDIVANAHGGEILLNSEPGSYAEFTIRLPER